MSALCRADAPLLLLTTAVLPSLSRHGRPDAAAGEPWADDVTWLRGDVFDPEASGVLEHVDAETAVCFSLGILLEGNYKRLLGGHDYDFKDDRMTYEYINRDSALRLGSAVAAIPAESFTYVSANAAPPVIDRRYISSKREAEDGLLAMDGMRTVIMRPGFVYDKSRPSSLALAPLTRIGASIFSRVLGPAWDTRPTHLGSLADAIVTAAADKTKQGVFDIDGIQALANEH